MFFCFLLLATKSSSVSETRINFLKDLTVCLKISSCLNILVCEIKGTKKLKALFKKEETKTRQNCIVKSFFNDNYRKLICPKLCHLSYSCVDSLLFQSVWNDSRCLTSKSWRHWISLFQWHQYKRHYSQVTVHSATAQIWLTQLMLTYAASSAIRSNWEFHVGRTGGLKELKSHNVAIITCRLLSPEAIIFAYLLSGSFLRI